MQFPRSEAEIAKLTVAVAQGLEDAAQDFPAPPVPPAAAGRRRRRPAKCATCDGSAYPYVRFENPPDLANASEHLVRVRDAFHQGTRCAAISVSTSADLSRG